MKIFSFFIYLFTYLYFFLFYTFFFITYNLCRMIFETFIRTTITRDRFEGEYSRSVVFISPDVFV